MDEVANVKDDAGAQSRASEAGANSTERLGAWPSGFDGFINECESLQRDLKRNPYNAEADHERVQLLIEIAKKWHSAEVSGRPHHETEVAVSPAPSL